jgi:Arc/MetJ-type ribon-helix-helix transcriptional regulator
MANTTQITVRIPDELLAWLDAEVARGRYPSRAAGIARFLRKAQRAQEDEQNLATYLAIPETDDERSLREWASENQAWSTDEPARALGESADAASVG